MSQTAAKQAVRYQSPLSILSKANLNPSGILSKADLNLARKVLLAEFDLKQQTTINWEGREISRDDVLKMFDSFDSSNLIEFHNVIQQDPELKKFLEKHQFNPDDEFEEHPLYQNEAFKAFVGPYFGAALSANYVALLNNPDFVKGKALLAMPRLWDSAAEQQCWSEIGAALERKLEELKSAKSNLTSYGISVGGRGEKRFFHPDVVSLLNFLPDSFEEFRSNYGLALIELAAQSYNSGQAETCEYIVNRVKNLNGGYRFKFVLNNFIGELNKLDLQAARSSSSGSSGRSGTWVIISIVVALLRLMTLCNN